MALRRRTHVYQEAPLPFPTSVTIAKRLSVGRDVEGYRSDLCQAGRKYFSNGLESLHDYRSLRLQPGKVVFSYAKRLLQ
jgi:hypothetical protein